ncbi:MAG: hypothetical protein PVH18_05425, partial [Chloroflexota bacterium]
MIKELPKALVLLLVVLGPSLAFAWVANAQTGNGIYEPADGDSISGVVIVRGTAIHPQFLRYELAFLQAAR